MIDADYEAALAALGPLRLPSAYCPHAPNPKQEWFLRRDELEVFFGGAAGPGKSWGLLMAALQFVDVPEYHALLLRTSLTQFTKEGALMEVAHDWLGGTDAHWHGGERKWTFPSGATISFGYLANRSDLSQYKGPSYSFVGFDELTSFPEYLYRAMFRVLRQRREGPLKDVPLRMRSASNPGDLGHEWVKTRFIDPDSRRDGALFIPASIHDNPQLDYDAYLLSLAEMHPVDRQRLIDGDWDVMEEGGKFHRQDFKIVDEDKAPAVKRAVRYWDLAGTEVSATNPDPDETVGLKMGITDSGHFVILDINAFRKNDDGVEAEMKQTAEEDGTAVDIFIEQEPGASGKLLIGHYRRKVLQGYSVYNGSTRGGDKEVRARPVSAAVANKLVFLVRGRNTLRFLDQCSLFPNSTHDDMVDGLSGAHTSLTKRADRGNSNLPSIPEGRIPGVDDPLSRSVGPVF